MKKRPSGFLRALSVLAVSMSSLCAFAEEIALFDFESGVQGWLAFSGDASMRLSSEKGGAAGSGSSLKASFKYGGTAAYLGFGVEPKWSMGGRAWEL